MNKQKLIGTIIGVIFFIVLIAGATFAWLTFTVNVTNGIYNASTGKFLINYTGGGTISSVPVVNPATPANTTVKQITAKLATDSISGKLTIKLTTESSTLLTTSGAIKYAVCTSSSTTSSCSSDFTSAVATGTITESGEKVLYADTNDLTITDKYYFVYFWVDASLLTNDVLETEGQNTYSGYIHASAAQNQ